MVNRNNAHGAGHRDRSRDTVQVTPDQPARILAGDPDGIRRPPYLGQRAETEIGG